MPAALLPLSEIEVLRQQLVAANREIHLRAAEMQRLRIFVNRLAGGAGTARMLFNELRMQQSFSSGAGQSVGDLVQSLMSRLIVVRELLGRSPLALDAPNVQEALSTLDDAIRLYLPGDYAAEMMAHLRNPSAQEQ